MKSLAIAVVSASLLALRAAGQDVLTSYDFSSLGFADSATLTQRGYLSVPPQTNEPVLRLAHAGNGVFFAIEGFSNDGVPDRLVRIDAKNGTVIDVGSTGFDWDSKGLDVDPITGIVYALANTVVSSAQSLYVIDTATGAATFIATLNVSNVRPATFAIDAQGRAFVLTPYASNPLLNPHFRVYRIDLSSGATTLFGDCPQLLTLGQQLGDSAFRADGTLLALSDSFLYAIDLAGLNATLMTQFWNRRAIACAPQAAVGLEYVEGCSGYPTGCPCGSSNTGAAGNGCAHSSNVLGANLRAYGTASLSNDTLQLVACGMPSSNGLFFQGAALVAPFPFGDGLRCVGGPARRMGVGPITNGTLAYPTPSAAPISVVGQITAPGTYHYQALFRDNAPYCTNSTIGLSNSISVTWVP